MSARIRPSATTLPLGSISEVACDLQFRHAAVVDAAGRHNLKDEAWAVVGPLLPVAGFGRPARNLRRQAPGAVKHSTGRVRCGAAAGAVLLYAAVHRWGATRPVGRRAPAHMA